MEILVFKTNILQKKDVERMKPVFNRHKDILKWNVDIEDEDKVLRVEAKSNITSKIEGIVKDAGYWCDELE
jgi:hypothetical protein